MYNKGINRGQFAVECDAKVFGSLCPLDVVAVNLYSLPGLDEFVKVMASVFFGLTLSFHFLKYSVRKLTCVLRYLLDCVP